MADEQRVVDDVIDDEDSLDHFEFDVDGLLCDSKGRLFDCDFYKDPAKDRQRFWRMGKVMARKVYELLEKRCNLKRLNLPIGVDVNEPHSFIFLSDNALTTTDRLLILIHGAGEVRAGLWARSVTVREGLAKGTQIPFVERAITEGYEVIILNTNLNRWPDDGSRNMPIPENNTPEEHALYVWRHLVELQAKAKHIAIVAHSYGGPVTYHLLQHGVDFERRVFAVALTDSWRCTLDLSETAADFLAKHTRNYVASSEPVGKLIAAGRAGDSEKVSAGHTQHEWTSYSSMESIFGYFSEKYKSRTVE